MHPKQRAALSRHGHHLLKFMATGRVPRLVRVDCPAVKLLRQIDPRWLSQITGVIVDKRLGYSGSRRFHNALQALHWMAPDDGCYLECTPPAAESWRDRRAAQQRYLDDLLGCASQYPPILKDRYRTLMRPATPLGSGQAHPTE